MARTDIRNLIKHSQELLNKQSLINIPAASSPTVHGEDSMLQLLGAVAHWGRSSDTGRAIWRELGKTMSVEGDLAGLGVDEVRAVVGRSEAALGDSASRALMVASESWQLSLSYRAERLRQARASFVATLSCVVLGVLILAIGICVSIVGYADFKVSTFTTVVGVFVEFVAGVLLWFHRTAVRRLDEEARVAHELERARLGIALITEINDPAARDAAVRSLIRDVRDHPSTITSYSSAKLQTAHSLSAQLAQK